MLFRLTTGIIAARVFQQQAYTGFLKPDARYGHASILTSAKNLTREVVRSGTHLARCLQMKRHSSGTYDQEEME